MKNTQTAVDWLAEQIKFTNKEMYAELQEAIEQAKAMEKEQIKDAFDMGDHCVDLPDGGYEQKYKSAEQYYEKTHNQ